MGFRSVRIARYATIAAVLAVTACADPDADTTPDADTAPVAGGSATALKRIVATQLAPKLLASGGVRVIVGVAQTTELEGRLPRTDMMRQRAAIAGTLTRKRVELATAVTHLSSFETIPFMVVDVRDAAGLERLVADSEITSIQEDHLSEPVLSSTAGIVQATNAWANSWTGSGYAVAVIDTGVYKTHSFLSGKVISEACYSTTYAPYGSTSLCPGGVSSSTATDSGLNCSSSISGCDHGTHVASIAAGANTTYNGIAKGANIIAIMAGSQFSGAAYCTTSPCVLLYTSDWIRGLERVATLHDTGTSIAAVNMSLGGGSYSADCDSSNVSAKAAIDNLRSRKIATIIATGNDSKADAIGSPACISTAISVGASTDADTLAYFSNNHSALTELLAPGFSIIAAGVSSTTATATKNGTSMAAPHVAGAWAVMRSAKSDMTVSEGLTALQSTGTSVTDDRVTPSYTKPRINIDDAIKTLYVTAPSLSPAPGEYSSAQTVTVTGPTSGSTLFYTLNGGTPSPLFGTGISSGGSVVVSSNTDFNVGASKTNLKTSYLFGGYTFASPLTVNISPAAAVTNGAKWRRTSLTSETFENGVNGRFSWASTNGTWYVDNTFKHGGSYSLRSPALADGQTTSVAVTLQCSAGTVTAHYKYSTEVGKDTVQFQIDGLPINGEASGYASSQYDYLWVTASKTITAGTHTFRMVFKKDASGSGGHDAVWLDDITWPCDEWRASGTTVQGTVNGTATIAFADATGYVTPSNLSYTHSAATPTQNVTYATQTGSLAVTITPTAAVTAGAKWRVDGGAWQSSGTTVSGLSLGTHSLEFSSVTGFTTPSSQSPTISYNTTTNATGAYTQLTAATPTFGTPGGTYTTAQSVTLSTTTPGATIRYTTNGTTPTASSTIYTGAITVPLDTTTTIKAKAFATNYIDSAEASATYVVTGTVATPTLGTPGGTYTAAQSVTLSTATAGATIRYTTNGTAPTASSTVYTGAIVVPTDTTMQIRAKAFKTNWIDSGEASATYVVTGTVATPTFGTAGGTYTTAQSVTLSTATAGATIRYTTDGSTPTAASTIYTGAINVPLDTTTTIKAKAFKSAWADSAEASATFVVTGSVATPVFDLAAGTYTTAKTVALTTATTGATIRYTTDGSSPTASSAVYSAALELALDTTTTIKAKAFKPGWVDSAEVSATYVITGTVATPTPSVAPGTYDTVQTIALSTATAGATIRYTTDGTQPTAASTAYTAPLVTSPSSSLTIRAIALKPDWTTSGELTATYTITCTPQPPAVTLVPSSHTAAPGTTVVYTASITNASSTGCLPADFALTRSAPLGWTTALEASMLTLAPGETDTVDFTVTSPASALESSNTVSVTASSQTTGMGTGTATYDVTCTRNDPELTFGPAMIMGDYVAVTYTATITNHDVGCLSSAFDVDASVPAGWTGSLSAAPLTIASGETAQTVLTVTPDAGSPEGDYPVSVELSRGAFSTDASATYRLIKCVRNAPTLDLSPATQSAVRGGLLHYTASITNNDVACGNQTFTPTVTVPSGWSASATGVTVASSETATFDVAVTSSSTAPAGDYTVELTVVSPDHADVATSAGYTVVPSCERAAPTITVAPVSGVEAPVLVHYSVMVTNHDHVDCGGSSFDVSTPDLPNGWTASSTAQTIASGATATFDLSVTPPTTQLASTTTFAIKATNAGATAYHASTQASYVLGCTRAAPSLSFTPAGSNTTKVTLTNADPSSCGTSAYHLAATTDATLTLAPAEADLTVAAGAAGSVDLMASGEPGDHTVAVSITRDGAQVATGTYIVTIADEGGSGSGDGDGDGGGGSGGGCAATDATGSASWLIALALVALRRRRRS